MADKKVIAVVGATGAQGGGLAQSILDDTQGAFSLRALTRNPASEAAQALARQGAEVVRADLDDVDSLRGAFDGAYGAYCMTNFFEHFSADQELKQAANLAVAAKTSGIQHAIWSTLEDTRDWFPLHDERLPTLQGRYKVPNFDAKGEGNRFFREADVPTTFLLTSFFWDNFLTIAGPMRDDDGALAITLAMGSAPVPGIAGEDVGRCAYGIFNRGDELIGRTVAIAGEHLTADEMVSSLGEALSEEIRHNNVPLDVFRSFPFPGADLAANTWQFVAATNNEYCARRDVGFSRSLNPRLQSFQRWVTTNKERIPVPANAT